MPGTGDRGRLRQNPGFSGDSVVNNWPAGVGDAGSIPDLKEDHASHGAAKTTPHNY